MSVQKKRPHHMVWPFLLDGVVKNDISARDEKQPPAGRPPNRSPAQRVRFGSEEILNRAQFSPQGGNGAVLGISELVRVVGLEPTSIAALEPKSSMFTNFIIPAYMSSGNTLPLFLQNFFTEVTAPKSRMSTNSITGAYSV